MENFTLTEEYIELIRLLKVLNWVESGGMAKMVVDDGLVKVNGQTEYRKRCKLRKGDRVDFEGMAATIA
jgi:ribosome-associated protein